MRWMLLPYLHYAPALQPPFDLAATAAVAGRVSAGPGLVLRDCATLRADGEAIRIGAGVFFAERSTVHIVDGRLPAVIGDRVTVAGRRSMRARWAMAWSSVMPRSSWTARRWAPGP
jgi:carbonic anhydrase/acetyltransferase-like protein (isoleucine patch superfamily)